MFSQTIQPGKCDGSNTSQGHALEEGVNVPHTGQNPDDFNSLRNRQVKNQIIANGETAQSGHEFVSTGADVGELCEGCTPFVNAIKQPVGSVRVILGNVPPDIIKVSFS